jgi:SAM-dependent methyltransferase
MFQSMSMWDDRYREPGFAYGRNPNDFLRQHAERMAGPVLCLAEGEGRNAVYLASLGLEVVAVDASAVGLRKAAELAASSNVSLQTITGDLEHFDPEPASYRSIISIFAHLPPAVRRRVHSRITDWLIPGGIFLLEAYTPSQTLRSTGGPRTPELCMSISSLTEELVGLRVLLARELDRDVIEGKYHTGMASVVQVIAVKE